MRIFIDFDDVLFNTKKFKEDCFGIFQGKGVSRKIFDECYYDPLDNRNIKVYDVRGHISRICKKMGLDAAVFEEEVGAFVADTSQYVFSDVAETLKKFHKKDLNIISFSVTNFQKSKIVGSDVAKFFNKIRIVNVLKGAVVAEIIEKEKMQDEKELYFIDDRTEQLESVKKRCPQVKTILCVRREGRYRDRKNKYCDYKIANLKELAGIIKIKPKTKNGK